MRSRTRAHREVSAGGVVYRTSPEGPLVLLIRDSYDNWGFPKGHLEDGEAAEAAAVREVREETGVASVDVRCALRTIDWYFRFRGRLIHKICHFFLMATDDAHTAPQAAEGITACRWVSFDDAHRLVSYDNAREVLAHARLALADARPRGADSAEPAADTLSSGH